MVDLSLFVLILHRLQRHWHLWTTSKAHQGQETVDKWQMKGHLWLLEKLHPEEDPTVRTSAFSLEQHTMEPSRRQDEAQIYGIVYHSDKLLQGFDCGWLREGSNGRDFGGQRTDSFCGYAMSKEVNFFYTKNTFIMSKYQSGILQALKHYLEMLKMLVGR